MKIEYENAQSLNLQKWSECPEVDAVVDAVYDEIRATGSIKRNRNQRTSLKAILVNLYACHASDVTKYIRYSRSNKSWIRRYNCSQLSAEQVRMIVNQLTSLGYVTDKLGKWSPYEECRRQSRMRATEKLIDRFNEFNVSPLMIIQHRDADTIYLRDNQKKFTDYDETEETTVMRSQMKAINTLISKTLINIYMPDVDLAILYRRMIEGEESADDEHLLGLEEELDEELDGELIEISRGAIDFTKKSLCRVFNNGNFRHGGRLYGGWWQGVPKEYRKYIRINRMNTVEVDFSSMHINLIYWIEGIPVPEGDLYRLDRFPDEATRNAVKRCLLTLINAKNKKAGMRSIREHIKGVKVRYRILNGKRKKVELEIKEKKRIYLPVGVEIEKVITAFERKHKAIKHWFFSGKGVELQYWDSQIAIEILLRLEKAGVPCLPLHDSFIVSFPQERGLRKIMSEAFLHITGKLPRMDAKDSLIDENKERGLEAMKEHYNMKMVNGTYSENFKNKYHTYFNSINEWKSITGNTNIFTYSKSKLLNPEIYGNTYR